MNDITYNYEFVEEEHYSLKIQSFLHEKSKMIINVRTEAESKCVKYISENIDSFGSYAIHFYSNNYSRDIKENGVCVTENLTVNVKIFGTKEELNVIIKPSLVCVDGSISLGFF